MNLLEWEVGIPGKAGVRTRPDGCVLFLACTVVERMGHRHHGKEVCTNS